VLTSTHSPLTFHAGTPSAPSRLLLASAEEQQVAQQESLEAEMEEKGSMIRALRANEAMTQLVGVTW
jgi:hypothetical protein